MTEITRTLSLLLISALLVASCEQTVPVRDDVKLAEVGDRVLYLSDLKKDISIDQYSDDSISVIERYRNNWINRQLKVKEAERLELDQHEEVMRRIAKAKETILVDAFNEAVYLKASGEPVSRSDAHAYYESNKENFVIAERHVRFRHMMTASLSDAQNAKAALLGGRSWQEVVETYSVSPRRAIRNAQQYWPVSSAAREYEPMHDFIQVIGVSEISPIRRIGNHFHFVQLMETREAGEHPQVEWMIDQVTEWLMIDRKRKQLRAMEQNLFLQSQANNEIRIFDVSAPNQELEIITDSL